MAHKMRIVTFIGAQIVILIMLTRLFMPKYMTTSVEGNLIASYYSVPKEHDLIFIGDCEVYESFSPITLWEEHGITAFVRGSAQQLVWQSYYIFEETLTYEKPEVVVFSVLALQYDTPQREAYNRLTLDGMRWSASKHRAIKASMMPNESYISYVFPLLRYHDRWRELSAEDWRYLWRRPSTFYNGYYMRKGVQAVGNLPASQEASSGPLGEQAMFYLEKMAKLASDNGVTLVLVKAPTQYPYWYDHWDAQISDFAKKHNLLYINYLHDQDGYTFEGAEHTYNGGLHLNVQGAEALSSHFGAWLKQSIPLKDHRQDPQKRQVWEPLVNMYYEGRKDD